MSNQPAPRRRHLMNPANPQPRYQSTSTSLTRVQQWVMSTLAASLILHLAAGLMIGAAVMGEDRKDARIGLVIIAGILGFLAVVAALAIHKAKFPNWWLLVGPVPGLVGAWIVFG